MLLFNVVNFSVKSSFLFLLEFLIVLDSIKASNDVIQNLKAKVLLADNSEEYSVSLFSHQASCLYLVENLGIELQVLELERNLNVWT